MLELDTRLTINKELIDDPNLCHRLTEDDLKKLGIWVRDNYERDYHSADAWRRRNSNALNLAMQVQEEKSFPWPDCSNIKFPLVTIAAMQFHSRAYPAIVNGRSVVQCRVIGKDKTGMARERADKISRHMSWQRLEEDQGWEEDADRSLLNLGIVGCGFAKSYYSASLGYNVSEYIQARHLVVNYWARSIEDARCKTHEFPLYRNDIHERAMRGSYREDVLKEEWYSGPAPTTQGDDEARAAEDRRRGFSATSPDESAPFTGLEQHTWIDLDGDGYEEPYVVTIEKDTGYVLRIVTRFDRIEDVEYNEHKQIIKITATEYFTKRPFIPAPDGGIYDIGFGTLLGPLNESVDAAINQMFDAATLSNTAGGFIGRGAKLKGGVYQFAPFSWNKVDATGDDLRKSIVPLTVREPSNVMFQLLSLLIEYCNRVAGSTDMMVGENPGQNTPAETSRAMVEQGQKIYSAIFKRIWRSFKMEFKKLYRLNGLYLPTTQGFGDDEEINREDYLTGSMNICPAADPLITSDTARFMQAQMLADRAGAVGGYDTDEVEKLYLRALGIDDIDRLFPGTKNQPPATSEKVQIQQMKNEMEQMKLQVQQQQFMLTMQEMVRKNNAEILRLEAEANKLSVEATSIPGKQNVEAFRAGIEAMRERSKQMETQLDSFMETMNGPTAGITGGVGAPVPGMEGSSGDTTLEQIGGGPAPGLS